MSKIVRLYCEGGKGSHDYDILEKVMDGFEGIKIEPIGGVRGAGAIIQYKENEEGAAAKSNFYLLFRDRDFDKEIPDKPCLEQDEKKEYCYYSYRNTIENYLFDPGIFYDFLVEKGLQQKYKISNKEEVTEKFIEAAEKIKYYQAVRHTLGKMRTAASFETKWVGKSGRLPDSLEKDYCREQALKLIREAVWCTEKWTEIEFDTVLDSFLQKFDADFMNRLDFLIWFQGKDFAASLGSIMPNFPLKKYYKMAKDRFDYKLYPDLVELRQIIEKNSGG
jgi:hypothetical protein